MEKNLNKICQLVTMNLSIGFKIKLHCINSVSSEQIPVEDWQKTRSSYPEHKNISFVAWLSQTSRCSQWLPHIHEKDQIK